MGKNEQIPPSLTIKGAKLWSGLLSVADQTAILEDIRGVVARAPLFVPVTPSGKKMSVRMTSAGRFGWVTDRRGYRYEAKHPAGVDWPEIPETVLAVWNAVSGAHRKPDCCLINFYDDGAKMGMHQDKDEADFSFPVVSISMGDDALFRMGNAARGGKTESVWLRSGDVLSLEGDARLAYHGIDRIKAGTSTVLKSGGRINLTMRVVT